MKTKKEVLLEKVQKSGLWCSEACVKLLNDCDDVSKLVLPASMAPLQPLFAKSNEEV